MPTTVDDTRQFVEEVVEALTMPPEGEQYAGRDLREQMHRAAAEFDRRTAHAFGKALVDALCEDPGDVRLLEALLILGLAHPRVVKKYGISLSQEGRRLAVLLEQIGEGDRARCLLELLASSLPGDRTVEQELGRFMRNSGETDEVIERCLRQADLLVAQGRSNEAIPWLQEVLLHDRSRRDVARMIRDLRYQDIETKARRGRARRLAMALVLLTAATAGLVVREQDLAERYALLPAARPGDSASHVERLVAVEELQQGARVWSGMFRAAAELSELRQRIDRLAAHEAQRRREQRDQVSLARAQAAAARERGLIAVQNGELEQALADFREALELGVPGWEHRPRLEADVQAIEEWLGRQER